MENLTSEDLAPGGGLGQGDHEMASIRAAANPNPAVLQSLLELSETFAPGDKRRLAYSFRALSDPEFHGKWNSPLIQAALARLPQNVEVLLQAGADPNGIDIDMLSYYALWFLRGRRWSFTAFELFPSEISELCAKKDHLRLFNTTQIEVLTPYEVSVRTEGFNRFWTEPEYLSPDSLPNGDSMPAVIAAAKVGDIRIFDQLCDAHADTSFWLSEQDRLPQPPTHSSLAVSTPLHAAILNRKPAIVRALLARGFHPNTLPLAAPTRAYTPLQSCLMVDPPLLETMELLLSHPWTTSGTLTPIFGVHFLHFAAAHRSIHILRTAASHVALDTVRPTALQHTLLHIACLPYDFRHVNIFAPKIYTSIHEIRALEQKPSRFRPPHATSIPQTETWNDFLNARTPLKEQATTKLVQDDVFPRPSSEEHTSLVEVIKFLLESGTQNILNVDVHGNTALHYLSGHLYVCEEAITILCNTEKGKEAYEEVRNYFGYTAKELREEGQNAVIEPRKPFWTAGRYVHPDETEEEE